jgi:hypothetical protein
MRMRTIYEDIQYDEWNDCVIVIGDDVAVMEGACKSSDMLRTVVTVAVMLASLMAVCVVSRCI